MLSRSTLERLKTQLDVVPQLLANASNEQIDTRPPSGQWSARENLAHLACHHGVMVKRLRRILNEDVPRLDRYSADADPDWPAWSAFALDEILNLLSVLRFDLIMSIEGMTAAELERTGVHPLLGEMSVAGWLEFFLLHEAHHLYLVMIRLGQARSAAAPTE